MSERETLPTPSLIAPADLDRLSGAWKGLLSEAGAPPFASPVWYATWLAHFEAERPLFAAFHDGAGRLRGVVPLSVDGLMATGLGNPKIQDYAGLAIARGWEGPVLSALLEWAESEQLKGIRLWGILGGSALARELPPTTAAAGWTAESRREAVAPLAEVGNEWETFVSTLSKKNRHELRRKLRNLESAGDVAFETIIDPDAVRETVAVLIRMMRESHEGKTRFLTPEMEAFFLDMGPAMAKAGSGRAWRLSLDGREAAILLGFDQDGTRFLYNSGFDPEFGKLAVGLLSKALAMRAGARSGIVRFDFLRGDEEYKRRLGGREQEILEFSLGRRD